MIDVLAIQCAVIVVLGLLFILPALRPASMMTSKPNCVNHLKQVGLAFRLWSGDNADKYPMQVSTNQSGTMERVASGAAYPHLAALSNELSTPGILLCPQETSRSPAGALDAAFGDANVSYFVVPEADETLSLLWLCGDRNLEGGNIPLKLGSFVLATNTKVGWTRALHKGVGNICLADGCVQQLSSAGLERSAGSTLACWFAASTNGSFRLLIP